MSIAKQNNKKRKKIKDEQEKGKRQAKLVKRCNHNKYLSIIPCPLFVVCALHLNPKPMHCIIAHKVSLRKIIVI